MVNYQSTCIYCLLYNLQKQPPEDNALGSVLSLTKSSLGRISGVAKIFWWLATGHSWPRLPHNRDNNKKKY